MKDKIKILFLVYILSSLTSLAVFSQEVNETLAGACDEYLNVNNYSKARECLEAIKQQEPENQQAIYKSALLNYYTCNHEQAEEELAELLAVNKDHADALYLMSLLLFEQSKYQQSLTYIDKVLTLDPDYTQALSLKCSIYSETGQHKEAKNCLKDLF